MNFRYLAFMLTVLISTVSTASDFGNWTAAEGYTPTVNHQFAFESAKAWALEHNDHEKYRYNYVYEITETESGEYIKKGFYVFVDILTYDQEMKAFAFPGGHFGLYIDEKGAVYHVFLGA